MNSTKVKRTSWKPGRSGNPKGRPPDGESWAGLLRAVGNMTAGDVVRFIETGCLTAAFRSMPQHLQLKILVVLRVYQSLICDPQAAILKEVMERTDGKITDRPEPPSVTINVLPPTEKWLKQIHEARAKHRQQLSPGNPVSADGGHCPYPTA